MALRIEPGTAGEAEDIADVHLRAMEDNLLLHAQFPNPESLAFLRNWLAKDTVEHTQDLGKGILVARDEATGEIASFVKWLVHRPAEQDSSEPAQEEQWPASCRVKYLDSYSALTQRVRDSVMGDKPFYHVTFLCTKPDFAGKGAASKLLRQVQERASLDGLTVILESTMNAVTFYERLGFQIRQSLGLILPARGSDDPTELYEERCMTWTRES